MVDTYPPRRFAVSFATCVVDCKSYYPLHTSRYGSYVSRNRRPPYFPNISKTSGSNSSVPTHISPVVLSNQGPRRDVIVIMSSRIRVVGNIDRSHSSGMSGGRSAPSGQFGKGRFILLRDLEKCGGSSVTLVKIQVVGRKNAPVSSGSANRRKREK